jgi:DNA mismatch repair ATPase MutS
MAEFGSVLKLFYECYDNDVYNKAFLYSFGFHGYVDSIQGMQAHLSNKKMHLATFLKKPRKNKFKQSYYAALMHKKPIKNDIDLQKNIIITGPNASGKTTVLKATLINIVLTQQWGCGFYKGAQLYPYDHIHCYLNIPDTSERDSLFQAESRRCKEILDVIRDSQGVSGTRHYCIFDELYSGTNPDEATKSAYALLKYLTQYSHVDFILTTHYVSLCKKLKKCKEIRNYKMEVVLDDQGEIQYTYRIKPGISKIQGAVRILEDMNYPAEILQEVRVAKDRSTKKKAKAKAKVETDVKETA